MGQWGSAVKEPGWAEAVAVDGRGSHGALQARGEPEKMVVAPKPQLEVLSGPRSSWSLKPGRG